MIPCLAKSRWNPRKYRGRYMEVQTRKRGIEPASDDTTRHNAETVLQIASGHGNGPIKMTRSLQLHLSNVKKLSESTQRQRCPVHSWSHHQYGRGHVPNIAQPICFGQWPASSAHPLGKLKPSKASHVRWLTPGSSCQGCMKSSQCHLPCLARRIDDKRKICFCSCDYYSYSHVVAMAVDSVDALSERREDCCVRLCKTGVPPALTDKGMPFAKVDKALKALDSRT